MIKKMSLLFVTILLSGCLGSIFDHEKKMYRCSFDNISTKKTFYAASRDRFRAIKKAEKICKNDQVPQRCYFHSCQE